MWPFWYPELSASHVGIPREDIESVEDSHAVYDYIVVGGGTAGCVLAARLSEEMNMNVLLVERGVWADSWASTVPHISSDFRADSAPAYTWKTVPQHNADDQELQIVAGKALGGTSRINSTLYTRGAPAEWNAWSQAGRKGWSYEELPSSEEDSMLDHFIRRGAQTEYHYTSTCRMAPEDEGQDGVVDDELRVHGVEGLRVADASVFPSILATHTQAPTVVVAERCADVIKRAHGG